MANLTQELTSKVNLFKSDLSAHHMQSSFAEVFSKNDGDWSFIRRELKAKEGFSDAVIKKLEFTDRLAGWCKNQAEVVAMFKKDSRADSLRDIARKMNKSDFVEKIRTVAPGRTDTEKNDYVLQLRNDLFRMEPTAMLVNMINDPRIPLMNNSVGAHVAAMLNDQPDFNIKTTSVYELIKKSDVFKRISAEAKAPVEAELKTLQRLAVVSHSPDALPMLFDAKVQSAMQISSMPRQQFVKSFGDSGVDEQTLEQIHRNAQQIHVRSEQFLVSLRETVKPTGVAFIDRSLNVGHAPKEAEGAGVLAESKDDIASHAQKLIEQHNLSWDLLFGDADLCECGECNSVYSPASYFVELLNYLRNNNLDANAAGGMAIKANPKDISGTPLEKLFERRPDLGCLELTCKNTNTVLPYVDLVNEVMENYVAFKKLKTFNVDDETSSELLAGPQHTEYKAYCILKNEVYPFTLPYHQAIDAARIYLKFLGTSRHELIKTFRKNNSNADADLARMQDEAWDRAADAECLSMTKEEYVILTRECFEGIELMRKLKANPAMTRQEYWQGIGGKSVHEYYGYADAATMLGHDGLTQIKKEFLRRTGIDYVDLVALLKTESINPYMPKGRSKAIMESLHFSYRFLQNYAEAHGLDKMAEGLVTGEHLADLAPMLKQEIDLLTNRASSPCPAGCADTHAVCDKDIVCWVKCCFEKVGKMIVIESGRGCANGKIIAADSQADTSKVLAYQFLVQDCKIYFVRSDEKRLLGEIDKFTGRVSFQGERIEPQVLSQLLFIGDKGEKGRFFMSEGEAHLVYLEQKDSCNLDTALLQHLDGTPLEASEYDRIHRFIRLWRKLEWTIPEIDQAIVGLGMEQAISAPGFAIQRTDTLCGEADDCSAGDCGCEDCAEWEGEELGKDVFNVGPRLIHQLAAVRQLLDMTGLPLSKLLSFWGGIGVAGEDSLYRRLFLTHNLLGIDKVFAADARGNYLAGEALLTEHMPALMAALNLSAEDLHALIAAAGWDGNTLLTLDKVSLLYRYRLLSKVLGLRMPAFLGILPLYGDVFADADATLGFLKKWARMDDAGFTHQQLNYIIRDVDDKKKPFSPSEKSELLLSKTLYDGLNAIDKEHQDITADPAIGAEAEQQFNIQQKASADLVRSKGSLLFESAVMERVVAFLEGATVYITNAPKNLAFNIPDSSTLKPKLKYDGAAGAVQISGILTDSERVEYGNLNASAEWSAALTRIQKQQSREFKELFAGIFSDETSKTAADKAALQAILKAGDVSAPVDGLPDPNTAPQKRAAFLAIFLPYLRQQLSHRFVIERLAAFVAIEPKCTEELLVNILKRSAPSATIYQLFADIKDSAQPIPANWSGYLIASADTAMTFVVREKDTAPVVSIDGVALKFTAQEDPTNEWWSSGQQMVAGKLYKLVTSGVEIGKLFWKSAASSIAAIPSSALIPDFAPQQAKPALAALKKAAMLVSGFKLSADELRFLHENRAHFDGLDFNALSMDQWFRMEAYTRLRNALPAGTTNILDFWRWTYDAASDPNELSGRIADLTAWARTRVEQLAATEHFNIKALTDFRDEKNLLKLQEALSVADKLGADINHLFDWSYPTPNFSKCRKIADSIRNAIRARYNQSDWEQVVKPLHDELRNHQRDALTGYLLQRPELIAWDVTDADGLFEYFLIDVQMDACMQTSRIKQALSSTQLFIQRCFLGLEEEHSGIGPEVLDRDRWEWMQRYRVWEANRKVFLYPENWIEGNLRDDKSPFFRELEGELLQKDISKQSVQDALRTYLYKVDEVSNMEVVGLHIEGQRQNGIWAGGSKLHVFARTRSAPYVFYYRFFALSEKYWYPWEKMQVDISNYDSEGPSFATNGNGCYLAPVVWNNRLLVFFPQIVKKSRQGSSAHTKFRDLADAGDGVTQAKAIEYFDVKMAWSEYRNGKWTQKQLSKCSLASDPIDAYNNIQYFKIVPIWHSDRIVIAVDDNYDHDGDTIKYDGGYLGAFQFDGHSVTLSETAATMKMPILYFNHEIPQAENQVIANVSLENKRMYSWQVDAAVLNRDISFFAPDHKEKMEVDGVEDNFHHANIGQLLREANGGRLAGLFERGLSDALTDFGKVAAANGGAHYHELKAPYSLYNWELFFHTPVLLADALSKAQHFEEAMKWFHYVFNPMAEGDSDKRFWQFRPFTDMNSKQVLDTLFNNLAPNASNEQISDWRDHPFMPHRVARGRPVAYMKWVVMKYIDNLLAWGDYLFRQDTIETINQATQLYVLAGHILGPRPMMIPKRGKVKPQSYLGLLDKWDAFGNAMVELELAAPFSEQTTLPLGMAGHEVAYANIYGMASALYFCIPNNPRLAGYWDTVADRMYKIRHCLNFEGVFRQLPLFEPPIDPALLVKAAAQGLSIASVLNDLNTPMPNYRFYYLLQKAIELCGELKTLGGAMLSALEKQDNEAIALLRAKHDGVMQNLLMEIKKKQVEEAQKNIESLQQNRKGPEARMKYYLKLSGLDEGLVPGDAAEFNGLPNNIATVDGDSGLKLISFEKEDMDKAGAAADWQIGIGVVETLASVFHALPTMGVHGQPLGVGASMLWGFPNLANATSAVARGLRIQADHLSYQSSSAGKKGGFTRALQERIFQANAAGYEKKQIDKQILAQQIRIEIANQDITNQQQAIDNANEIEDFLKNKFSNDELYSWMRGSLKTLYRQVYNLAYDLAKKAEKTYCFERGVSNVNFIQPGYFDAGRDGLLAGEQLYVGLKQLEAAYLSERGYDYEVTRHISLYQLDPMAVIQLRETGHCEFVLPEALFDLDYPGHYKRRIKSLSLSMPCVVGPYTGVNATLRLLENRFRNTAICGRDYAENTDDADDRFSSSRIPISAIGVSSGQGDSGTFELSFKDERYLPFEGAGLISKWRLELPAIRQFDYQTVADVVLHVKYTACEGGEHLKAAASQAISDQLGEISQALGDTGLHVAFDMRHDLSNEWQMFKSLGTVDISLDMARMPYLAQLVRRASIEGVTLLAKTSTGQASCTVKLGEETLDLQKISDQLRLCRSEPQEIGLGETFNLSAEAAQRQQIENLYLVVKYAVETN